MTNVKKIGNLLFLVLVLGNRLMKYIFLENNPEKLSEQEILKSLVKQAEDTENKRRVKSVRKVWFPVNQAWYDQECQVSSTVIAGFIQFRQ